MKRLLLGQSALAASAMFSMFSRDFPFREAVPTLASMGICVKKQPRKLKSKAQLQKRVRRLTPAQRYHRVGGKR